MVAINEGIYSACNALKEEAWSIDRSSSITTIALTIIG